MSQEKLKTVIEQILNRIPAVRGKGEQATKQSIVIPMLDALGYDIWNPTEICPEYEADFAVKKAGQKEKVDIAVIISGIPRIYIEVKAIDESLDKNEGQLARYFNATTSVTLGILTNGLDWRFYTDTGDPNVMDFQPFHSVSLDSIDQGFEVLTKFSKTAFSAEAIRDYATELKYTDQIASFLRKEIDLRDTDPSEYFVRWILKSDKMFDGVVTANVIERFRPITKAALTRVVREIVRRSISAMEQVVAPNPILPSTINTLTPSEEQGSGSSFELSQKSSIITTDRELCFFNIVKKKFEQSVYCNSTIFDASLRKDVPITISYKDTTGYFGIYFNKPFWWVIRACIEVKKPWIGFNIPDTIGESLIPPGMMKLEPHPHADFRIQINDIHDIDSLNSLVLATFDNFINEKIKNDKELETGI